MLPIFGILTSPQHQSLLIQIWLFNASRKRKDTTLSKSRLCNITRVHCWLRPIIWPLKQWLRQGKSFIKRKNKKTKLKQLTPCKALWCIPTFFCHTSKRFTWRSSFFFIAVRLTHSDIIAHGSHRLHGFFRSCNVLLHHGDDGFYGFCEHCMLTSLLARNVPVAKYVSTDYVVRDLVAATS